MKDGGVSVEEGSPARVSFVTRTGERRDAKSVRVGRGAAHLERERGIQCDLVQACAALIQLVCQRLGLLGGQLLIPARVLVVRDARLHHLAALI
jgi:hypothetical protein